MVVALLWVVVVRWFGATNRNKGRNILLHYVDMSLKSEHPTGRVTVSISPSPTPSDQSETL